MTDDGVDAETSLSLSLSLSAFLALFSAFTLFFLALTIGHYTLFENACELQRVVFHLEVIPLSKNPGVRPIGVCETLRRILGKVILRVVGPYIRQEVGMSTLCAGQRSGCETAVHAMTRLFEENDSTEGVLLVDASNTFNSLNRGVMLRNIRELCPAFSTCVTNFYRSSASLFVDGETTQSLEGTTEGDPLAMAIYALATLPLINRAKLSAGSAVQCWFADNAGAGGKLQDLQQTEFFVFLVCEKLQYLFS